MKTEFTNGFYTTSDGVRLHYIEAGSGQPIIFIPGWTMPAWVWEPQITHFSNQYHVIALDLRGQGESEKSTEGLHPERRAEDIVELITHLNLPQVTLAGWSNGVLEILTYLELYGAERVCAYVLVDTDFKIAEDVQTEISKFVSRMMRERQTITEKWVKGMFNTSQSKTYYQRLAEASLQTPTASMAAMFFDYLTGEVDFTDVIQKTKRPLLYAVTGEKEESAKEVQKLAPQAQVEIFRGAGHALFVDEAERFNTVLEAFLAG